MNFIEFKYSQKENNMKKLFLNLSILATLMMSTFQSTQAAWVVGYIASEDYNTDFSRTVNKWAVRSFIAGFPIGLAGMVTANPALAATGAVIMTLDEQAPNSEITRQIYEEFKDYDEVIDTEIASDLTRMVVNSNSPLKELSIKDSNGEEINFEAFAFSLNEAEVNNLLMKHGIELDSAFSQKLHSTLK